MYSMQVAHAALVLLQSEFARGRCITAHLLPRDFIATLLQRTEDTGLLHPSPFIYITRFFKRRKIGCAVSLV